MSLRPLPGGVCAAVGCARRCDRPRGRHDGAAACCCVLLPVAPRRPTRGLPSEDKELATLYGVVRGARHARVAGGAAESQVATRKATRAAGKEGHEGHEKHEGPTAVW